MDAIKCGVNFNDHNTICHYWTKMISSECSGRTKAGRSASMKSWKAKICSNSNKKIVLLTVWNRLISFGFFEVLVHHSHHLLDHFSLLKSFSNCQNTLKIKISLFLGYIWIGCSFPLSVIKWVISLGNCLYSILSISALHFEKCF